MSAEAADVRRRQFDALQSQLRSTERQMERVVDMLADLDGQVPDSEYLAAGNAWRSAMSRLRVLKDKADMWARRNDDEENNDG